MEERQNIDSDSTLCDIHSENIDSSATSDVEVMEDLKDNEKSRIVIVTGMSGGGKTQACRYLEDLGYFCVDNLPPVFIPKFVELCSHGGSHVKKVVFVVDTRSREFFDALVQVLEDMNKNDQSYEMLFMDAADEVIIRRYKETRRRHPMAPSSRISDGVWSVQGWRVSAARQLISLTHPILANPTSRRRLFASLAILRVSK